MEKSGELKKYKNFISGYKKSFCKIQSTTTNVGNERLSESFLVIKNSKDEKVISERISLRNAKIEMMPHLTVNSEQQTQDCLGDFTIYLP